MPSGNVVKLAPITATFGRWASYPGLLPLVLIVVASLILLSSISRDISRLKPAWVHVRGSRSSFFLPSTPSFSLSSALARPLLFLSPSHSVRSQVGGTNQTIGFTILWLSGVGWPSHANHRHISSFGYRTKWPLVFQSSHHPPWSFRSGAHHQRGKHGKSPRSVIIHLPAATLQEPRLGAGLCEAFR